MRTRYSLLLAIASVTAALDLPPAPSRAQGSPLPPLVRDTANTAVSHLVWDNITALWDLRRLANRIHNGADRLAVEEWLRRQERRLGLQALEEFPNDSLRLLWFESTMAHPPAYYADLSQAAIKVFAGTPWLAEIDTAARDRDMRIWEAQFPILRARYLAAANIDDRRKAYFRHQELRARIDLLRLQAQRGYPIHELGAVLEQFAQEADSGRVWASVYLAEAIDVPIFRNAEPEALDAFRRTARHSADTALRTWAEAWFSAREAPVELAGEGLRGGRIDVAQYRGKAVLIYLWHTSCGSCIAAFPRYKDLYARYSRDDVEFVFIAAHPKEDRAAVDSVVTRHALPWPHILAGDNQRLFDRKIAGYAVGRVYVFDRSGRLVGRGANTKEEIAADLDLALGHTPSRVPHE